MATSIQNKPRYSLRRSKPGNCTIFQLPGLREPKLYLVPRNKAQEISTTSKRLSTEKILAQAYVSIRSQDPQMLEFLIRRGSGVTEYWTLIDGGTAHVADVVASVMSSHGLLICVIVVERSSDQASNARSANTGSAIRAQRFGKCFWYQEIDRVIMSTVCFGSRSPCPSRG